MMFPVEVVPKPSRMLMAGLLVGHFVLGLAFLSSSLPACGIGAAWLGLASSAVMAYRRWRKMASLRFMLGYEGAIQVIPPTGASFEARAGQGSRDLGWAVWLAWQAVQDDSRGDATGHGGVLMLPRDAVPPATWRALRVWLRFRSGLALPEPDV